MNKSELTLRNQNIATNWLMRRTYLRQIKTGKYVFPK